ncbi:Oidioi.mRNA.OKI2018_I69.chr2.g5854.t1.cds [Oikopleura dioica]|uniref:Oidioi.mRNA.OKI2018_I69.chr2.g5854.t1.cds n=1 Tax=Oikopleura dioica TaxID=34765 RepID=A0ABN7T786_OIKDI|nr:Oidioi.mRNA.OKI2018_I69.chr2.g5854.t1.cds [Oikopleura dioica]
MGSSKKSIRCAISFLKGLITICSFISLISGSLLLGIGVYLLMMIAQFKEEFLTFVNDQVLPFTLIGVGIYIAITATTGLCLACNVRKAVVYCHSILSVIAFTILVSGGVLLLTFENLVAEELSNGLIRQMTNYSQFTSEPELIDEIQVTLGCCGSAGAGDWLKYGAQNPPDSCCSQGHNCWTHSKLQHLRVQDGCVDKLLGVKNEEVENSLIGTPYDNLNYLIIGILSFACLEILAAILSCCVGLKVHQLRHFSYHSGKN